MTTANWRNQLYFGDNLPIMREHIANESVDLIYLDPPFNSNADYNILFRERSGEQSAAQITAFEDTWHWSLESEIAYQDVVTNAPGKLPELLQAMHSFLGRNDMMAYLTMMAQRMTELRRVLKPAGSIYLHCDPTASHYLKLLMDSVFGASNFRNEIIWKRTASHGGANKWGPIHDLILFYSASGQYVWNRALQDYSAEYLDKFYKYTDRPGPLSAGNANRPGRYPGAAIPGRNGGASTPPTPAGIGLSRKAPCKTPIPKEPIWPD